MHRHRRIGLMHRHRPQQRNRVHILRNRHQRDWHFQRIGGIRLSQPNDHRSRHAAGTDRSWR